MSMPPFSGRLRNPSHDAPDGADLVIGAVLTNLDHDRDRGWETYRAWLAKALIIGTKIVTVRLDGFHADI